MSKITATTRDVEVSVEVRYEAPYSNHRVPRYTFSYTITIQNHGIDTIQLLRRYWVIFEGDGTKRVVEGIGVIGEQPCIAPEKTYQYASWCPIQHTTGYMAGHYLMINKRTGEVFEVEIPRFYLIEPTQLN